MSPYALVTSTLLMFPWIVVGIMVVGSRIERWRQAVSSRQSRDELSRSSR
jgi:hypothetical protein